METAGIFEKGKTAMNSMIRRAALGVALCLALLLVAGLAHSGEAKRRNVVFVLKNLVNPFCVDVKNGAEKAARDLGIKLSVLTPLVTDNNEEMMQLTEQAMASGECDVLVVFPADSLGMVPALQAVHAEGIPIVMLNTSIWSDEVIWETFVECENLSVGRSIGNALAERMGKKGNVILIEGVPGSQATNDRMGGAADAIAGYPDMKVIARQPGFLNRATAMEVMQNLLQSHPDVQGVFAMNDEMALGCVEAIDAAGRSKDIMVAGCNADKEGCLAVKAGRLAFTCDIRAGEQGYQAIAAAAKILDGEKLPPRTLIQTNIVDQSNIDEYLK